MEILSASRFEGDFGGGLLLAEFYIQVGVQGAVEVHTSFVLGGEVAAIAATETADILNFRLHRGVESCDFGGFI